MGLFSSIGKAIFGGKKKKSQTNVQENVSGTTTTQENPWAPAIPYLSSYLSQIQGLYGGGAPQISQMEQQGYDMLNKAVGDVSGIIDPAVAANNRTLSGEYLDVGSNPYLQDIAKRMGGEAMAGANASFGGRGRTGGGLNQYYVGQGVAGAVGDVYGSAYESERDRMLSAAGMAPSLAAGKLIGPQALIDAGMSQSARPYDLAAQYGGILSGIAGLGGTSAGTMDSSGTTVQKNYKQSGGLLGKIANHFVNKLFPS